MVCYCPVRKILYIHVPKTGGLTIESILINLYGFKKFTYESKSEYEFLSDPRGKLGIFRYILKYSNEAKLYDLKSFFKFAFVRDPYSRGVSAVRYLHKASKMKNIEFPSDLESFYQRTKFDNYYYIHFNTTQYRNLLDDEGEFTFDFIGRFENFEDDLNLILFDILKFPLKNIKRVHINKSDKSLLNIDELQIKTLVEIINNEDFDRFGYRRLNLANDNIVSELENMNLEN